MTSNANTVAFANPLFFWTPCILDKNLKTRYLTCNQSKIIKPGTKTKTFFRVGSWFWPKYCQAQPQLQLKLCLRLVLFLE